MSMNDLPPPPTSPLPGSPSPAGAVGGVPAATRAAAAAKLKVPAILLIVFASIGAATSAFRIVMAIVLSPEAMQQLIENAVPNAPPSAFGPTGLTQAFGVAWGLLFLVVNGVIIFGAIQALRVRSWPFALAAAIAAIPNIGECCCCVLTLPIGIWMLVILCQPEVKSAFGRP